jgi:hypothetical protein
MLFDSHVAAATASAQRHEETTSNCCSASPSAHVVEAVAALRELGEEEGVEEVAAAPGGVALAQHLVSLQQQLRQ